MKGQYKHLTVQQALARMVQRHPARKALEYLESEGLWDASATEWLEQTRRARRNAINEPTLRALIAFDAILKGDPITNSLETWSRQNLNAPYKTLEYLCTRPFEPTHHGLFVLLKTCGFLRVRPEHLGARVGLVLVGDRSAVWMEDDSFYPALHRNAPLTAIVDAGLPPAFVEYLYQWFEKNRELDP